MEELSGETGPVDPKAKKDSKKDTKKKEGKPGAKGQPAADELKVGQWTVKPCFGSIPPESSTTIEVTF